MFFGAKFYGPPADIWSVGCVFGEMFLRAPLFFGGSEMEVVDKIVATIGKPSDVWPVGGGGISSIYS
jgi:serine/threonine protein kinase